MCGRFAVDAPVEEVARFFELPLQPELPLRYNIAPTQPIAVVRRSADGGRELVYVTFGWLPKSAGERRVNARSETVSQRPAFRQAFRSGRCAVVASGFYEWQRLGGRKQPSYIRWRGGGPMAFAGILVDDGCVILTTQANALVAPLHDRMPVILPQKAIGAWLDPQADVRSLLVAPPAELLEAWPVSTRVNSPANDGPELLARVDESQLRLW